MFRTSLTTQAARGIAAGALILSLTATSFAGSAYAAPLSTESQDCSTLAHERNDAVHLLHTAWKTFRGDLKDLARDARKMDKESRKDEDKASESARSIVADANKELTSIFKTAHSDIQEAADLGQACKDQDEDEDTTSTSTNTTTTTNTSPAPTDSTAPSDSTTGGHTFDTSGLAAQYKDIVDKAIKDMQKVVDDATKALMDMKAADDTSSKTEVEKVKAEVEKAKTERVKDQENEHAKAKAERAKDKVDKANAKSNRNSDNKSEKSNDKSKGKGRD